MEFNSAAETATPEAAEMTMDTFELRDHIKKCLSEMRPKLREAFILRELEEMSYEEIAETLGCPIGTVRSRLNSARKFALRLTQQLLDKRGKESGKEL
jgi:RNA polymerase sigma-70 factor (ECF subfamily)